MSNQHVAQHRAQYRIFGLSNNASIVLTALKAGHSTPVQISKETNVSRPAIYAILAQLEEQGLVESRISENVKSWKIVGASQINKLLDDAKEAILGSKAEKEILYQEQNVEVKVYRGAKTITELMRQIFQEHRGETCIGIQGDNVYPGWRDVLGLETINELNKSIKKNGLINQAIVPQGHFERVVETMGMEWAEHFEGRAYRVNQIDEMYFKHKAEIFLFQNSVYLISMSEELVIEIKHSEIQKMLLLLLEYVQNTSRVVDGNEILRELMAQDKSKITKEDSR